MVWGVGGFMGEISFIFGPYHGIGGGDIYYLYVPLYCAVMTIFPAKQSFDR